MDESYIEVNLGILQQGGILVLVRQIEDGRVCDLPIHTDRRIVKT